MSAPQYDVILVGTGCCAGPAAYWLATAGLKVLNLEYGPHVADEELGSFETWQEAYQRIGYADLMKHTQRPGPGSFNRAKFFVYQDECDYKTEGEGWYWRRYRNVGGRSTWWNAVAPRCSPEDFREPEIDGFGPAWPVTYDDVKPYFDWMDRNIGRVGDSRDHPSCPAGFPQTPQGLRCGEKIIQHTCEGLQKELPLLLYSHTAKLIATHEMGPGRVPCSYLGNCPEGCRGAAKFDSSRVSYPKALQTGNLTLRPNSVVAEVIIDPDTGKASGVKYVDRLSKTWYEAYGKTVIVSASAIETPRILLNSKSRLFPNGVANHSGHVGRHLNDHVQGSVIGFLPQLYGHKTYNDDGYTFGVMIPRFTQSYQKQKGFIRGWEGRSGSGKQVDSSIRGFGVALKDGIRDHYQARISLLGFGAKLDNPGTYVEIDPSGEKDVYGIPIVKIHSAYHENDLKIFQDIIEKYTYILEQAGAVSLRPSAAPSQPGTSEHEVGTCRMTRDPKDGVCDGWGRTHEVKNLFVGDCSVFTQQTDKSPTLTAMALALRQADFIVEEFKRSNF